MTTSAAPAGWYPDSDPSLLRWWDGTKWTTHTFVVGGNAITSPPPPPPPPPPSTTFASPSSAPSPSGQHAKAEEATQTAPTTARHRLFGGKKDLESENAQLRAVVEGMGVNERDSLQADLDRLRAAVPQLQAEERGLRTKVDPLKADVAELETQREEVENLRRVVGDLTQQRDALAKDLASSQQRAKQVAELKAEYELLSKDVVETREAAVLQEVGIYQYRHPLENSPAYKARLTGLQAQIKDAVKAGTAIQASTTWTVNGSKREGSKMVRELSKLMLRAYNNEADNAVRAMKPYTRDSSIARLTKAKETISKLGATMQIRINDRYHTLRVGELELTADFLAKVAEEKERDQEERARLREEEIARREYERAQERLRKEQAQYENTLAALRERGDTDEAEKIAGKLEEIQDSIDGITRPRCEH